MSSNFSGTWKADLSQSKLLGPQATAMTITIEHRDPQLQEVIDVVRADGQEQHMVFKCWTDGREGGAEFEGKPIRANVRWQGDELLIEVWVNAGDREMHLCDYWSLSTDGQTLLMEHRNDDLAGQRVMLRRAA